MKLENEDTGIEEFFSKTYSIGMIIVAAIPLLMILPLFKLSFNKEQMRVIIYFLAIMYLFVAVIIIFIRGMATEKNVHKKNLKDIGEKISANIVDTGKFYRKGPRYIYYIVVCYGEKITKIYHIKDNYSYKILKLLLDPYPIEKNIAIPIDIYVYKNKVYADLDSVDLTKVEGFEEARKIVDSTNAQI